MKKEIPLRIILVTGLMGLTSYTPDSIPIRVGGEPKSVSTFLPTPIAESVSNESLGIPKLDITPLPPEPKAFEFPIARDCTLPFEEAVITSRFNELVLFNGTPIEKNGHSIRHLGIDLAPPADVNGDNIPIVSICDGQFLGSATIREGDGPSLGNIVVIKYFDSDKYFYAIYAHLEKALTDTLKEGDYLEKGQVIGTLGNSGGWINKHLHLQIWREKAWQRFVMSEGRGNMGLYPETWDEDLINQALIDPLIFLTEIHR
jgi:murein DD-endopeptidase MepM/ murein hydrolase activator NlpD